MQTFKRVLISGLGLAFLITVFFQLNTEGFLSVGAVAQFSTFPIQKVTTNSCNGTR